MQTELIKKRGGMKIVGSGGGKGGGGSARTPVESPDSLHNISYALILDAISNGELEGPQNPLNPLRDIFLDGTPIENDDGSLNYNNVQVEYRTGTIDQEYIPGFPSSSNTINVGAEVKTSIPWSQLVTNSDLSALRVTIYAPQLVQQIESGSNVGDRLGVSVTYAIDIAESGGSFVEILQSTFGGKNVNGYARTHRIELPAGANPWTVRVRRITPHPSSAAVSDTIYVQSYAEVIDGKFVYPMTALCGIKIDAEQFQAVPTRAYRWRGLKIKVPSNYNPIDRTYSGIWDGTLKKAWSNNPVWIYYDMLLSPLYGLGDRVDASMIDRYALYQIAAYCDELVSDGNGGLEPRFTCNVYLQSQADALKVINDLTSVFRGMAFWDGENVTAICDSPSDPIFTYTNANVKNSRFEYTGSDITTRKTVALVSYNDPEDFGRSKVEPVEDEEGIKRYGVRKTELVAFGCNSRSQAQRVGLYSLYTSRMETGGIAFSVGLDGAIAAPGKIVNIADANRAGRRIGGRISQSAIDYIVVDHEVNAEIGGKLIVNLPNGDAETRIISEIDERKLTVSVDFSQIPNIGAIWAIESSNLVVQQARIVSVKERDAVNYDIQAVFHNPGKFNAIDNGVRLEPLPVSVIPPRVQLAPDNITITEFYTFHQGVTKHNALISWDEAPNAISYDVQWRRDNSDWIQIPRTGVRTVELSNIFAGDYKVRVRAINALDVPSLWAYSVLTSLAGDVAAPPALESLSTVGEVMAIRLNWAYPNTPNIIEKVELRASLTNSFEDSYFLTEVAYPTISYTVYGLSYGTEMWFWGRLIDKNGLPGNYLPLPTGAGIYGKSSIDAENILSYLEGKIGAGELAPDLIEEIAEGAADGVESKLIGYLTGDQLSDALWYAGDDGSQDSFVGTVTIVSAYNSADFAQIQQIFILAARVSSNEAYIEKVDTASVSRDEALTSSLNVQIARIDSNYAAILSESETRANETSALSNQLSIQIARIDSNVSAISAETTARTDADTALANIITMLATQVDYNEATLIETSEALVDLDGAIKANWQVKAQVRTDGKVVQSGVALGAAIGEDGSARSEILLMADTIAFLNTIDGELHSPFIFDTVNDTVILNSAIIGEATISFVKIADDLQSTDYIAGEKGWKISKGGNLEFNGSVAGGGRMSINNQLLQVFDDADTLRVRLGLWT